VEATNCARFGGTNGFTWFNDVWCYDPVSNSWSSLDCIGYIPAPREGHAAAIVDDVMYIFGGRTEEGADLGDLAAFRISTRRWYTFQNMGPSPSPRSGHSMTAHNKQIVVLAGEPSTATREASDLTIVYLLDTSKIRYPNDQQIQQTPSGERVGGARRPSGGDKAGMTAQRGLTSRDGPSMSDPKRINGPPRESVMNQAPFGRGNGGPGVNGNDSNGVAPGSAQPQGPQAGAFGPNTQSQGPSSGSKLPRAAGAPQAPSGPPPQQQAPAPRAPLGPPPIGPPPGVRSVNGPPQQGNMQNNGRGKAPGRPEGFGPVVDTNLRKPSMENVSNQNQNVTMSPVQRDSPQRENPVANGRRTPNDNQQHQKNGSTENAPPVSMTTSGSTRSSSKSRSTRQQGSLDSTNDSSLSSLRNVTNRTNSPPPPTRQTSNPLSRKSSARNSQSVALLKELDIAKNRNAWYASELELARKAGYTPNPSSSPLLDQRAAESFDDDDKPLIEALLAMKQELANVQGSIDKQAIIAAKHIAEVEKQRDAAVSEAVYAKAKLAAHSGSQSSTPQPDSEARDVGMLAGDRSNDISRKLATALAEQRELKNQVEMLSSELESEKRGRKLAEDSQSSVQQRMAELEAYKHQNSSEVELLKAELHESQTKARQEAITCAEAVAAVQLLRAEKHDLERKYREAESSTRDHNDTFESLREAITSSADMKNMLERKLDEERAQREFLESSLAKLKSEHEQRTSELETATRRLRHAEDLAEQHANEARTHRQAVLNGLDKVTSRDLGNESSSNDERGAALAAQVAAANELARKCQSAADTASEKLRSAEERIAGLEAYQEQASREGMSIRKQLQANMREVQTLQAANSDLKHKLASQQLESNAVSVQHNTLKDILGERGISPAGASRTRGLSSPQSGANTPDAARLRELEQQLASSTEAHQNTKQMYESREQEAEAAYRDKLGQLEHDYQSAVHYVKGTEKMLKRMKDELSKYKSDNTRMKEQLNEHEERASTRSAVPAEWEGERASLNRQIETLQAEMSSTALQLERQMTEVQNQLASVQQERDHLRSSHEETQRELVSAQQARSELTQLQQENSLLEKRAQDAEQKVSLLLDQVEHSVDNYRRQSRQPEPTGSLPSHQRNRSLSAAESVSEASLYGNDNRTSMALDSLASELETLRTHWETTNKNYRLSNTFDFEERPAAKADEGKTEGLSGSLADWRKRLDAEEEASRSRKDSEVLSPGGTRREMSPSGKEVGAGVQNAGVNVI
jgi:chromosome segregation ATPase